MNCNTMSSPSITGYCLQARRMRIPVPLICRAPQALDNANAEIAFDFRASHIPGHFMSRRFNPGAA